MWEYYIQYYCLLGISSLNVEMACLPCNLLVGYQNNYFSNWTWFPPQNILVLHSEQKPRFQWSTVQTLTDRRLFSLVEFSIHRVQNGIQGNDTKCPQLVPEIEENTCFFQDYRQWMRISNQPFTISTLRILYTRNLSWYLKYFQHDCLWICWKR